MCVSFSKRSGIGDDDDERNGARTTDVRTLSACTETHLSIAVSQPTHDNMKRAPEQQLSREIVDGEESHEDSEDRHSLGDPSQSSIKPHTFERAPPEVIARRRIIKVQRTLRPSNTTAVAQAAAHPASALSAPPAPANPFASLGTATAASNAAPSAPANPFASLGAVTGAPKAATTTEVKSAFAQVNPIAVLQNKNHNNSLDGKPNSDKPDGDKPDGAKTDGDKSDGVKSDGANKDDVKTVEDVPALPGSDAPNVISSGTGGGSAQKQDKPLFSFGGNGDKPAEPESVETSAKVGAGEEKDADTTKDVDDSRGDSANDGADAIDKDHAAREKADGIARQESESKEALQKSGETRANISFGGTNGTTPVMTFASAAQGPSFGLGEFLASQQTAGEVKKEFPNAEKACVFKEEKVETGEENEQELFRGRAKLYSLEQSDAGGRWKERGVGSLKLKQQGSKGRGRLLMRTEATLRVVLNSALYEQFEVDKATERSLRFQGFDGDGNDAEEKRVCFLVRFSSKDIVASFMEAVEKWKANQGGTGESVEKKTGDD